MGKFLVRITTIFVSFYLIFAHVVAQVHGIDILTGNHVLLFELIVVVYAHSEGKYHCKFLKHAIMGIFVAECITRLDYSFNFFTISEQNMTNVVIISIGLSISVVKALIHFRKVGKLKRKRLEGEPYGSNNSTSNNI